MAAFNGIQVYEILENGNLLNGIYTNTGLSKKLLGSNDYCIDIEIARKTNDGKGVEGNYECKYIETNMQTNTVSATLCYLEISKHNDVYEFNWRDQNQHLTWTGIGLMADTNHIAVSYDGV